MSGLGRDTRWVLYSMHVLYADMKVLLFEFLRDDTGSA